MYACICVFIIISISMYVNIYLYILILTVRIINMRFVERAVIGIAGFPDTETETRDFRNP